MAISRLDKGAPAHFLKNGGVLIFDPVADYTSATLNTLGTPTDVGDILQDSTSWDGDEISFETINNELGEAVVSTVTNGTYAYSFRLMSSDEETIKKFLKAIPITISTGPTWMSGTKGVGYGTELASFEAPVGWVNMDYNQMLLFPKARVIAGQNWENNLLVTTVSVMAQKVDTENLKTVMLLSGDIDYDAE